MSKLIKKVADKETKTYYVRMNTSFVAECNVKAETENEAKLVALSDFNYTMADLVHNGHDFKQNVEEISEINDMDSDEQ